MLLIAKACLSYQFAKLQIKKETIDPAVGIYWRHRRQCLRFTRRTAIVYCLVMLMMPHFEHLVAVCKPLLYHNKRYFRKWILHMCVYFLGEWSGLYSYAKPCMFATHPQDIEFVDETTRCEHSQSQVSDSWIIYTIEPHTSSTPTMAMRKLISYE